MQAIEQLAVQVVGGDATARPQAALLEALCAGHFPGDPIVPGAWLLALVVRTARPLGPDGVMPVVKRCRFRAPVRPSDEVVVRVSARAGGADAVVERAGAQALVAGLEFEG